ncbi:MAG: T9SS C-terminal target domain-containing protein [Candidatus Zixiibacteriota bacterium]|nr:MAG: T9SS C-terminal target domain-containing protein [candidate division Zixibacteria bacterium]
MRVWHSCIIFGLAALLLGLSPQASAQIVQSGNFILDLAQAQGQNPQGVILETDVELLSNTGFETGSFPPWTHDGAWTISTTTPHTGTYCAYDVGNHWVRQEITPTPADQIVSATLWMRQPEDQISAIDFFYSNGTYSEDLIWPTPNWTQFNVTSFIDPGTVVTAIRIWGYSGGGGLPDETFIDDVSIQTAGGIPNVQVTLTPVNPPIQIPAGGGTFTFSAQLQNLSGAFQSVNAWIMQQTPSGVWQGPLLGPLVIDMPAGANVTRERFQNVPSTAAPGTYTYCGFVGTYNPTVVYDSSYFTYVKLSGDGETLVGDWNCAGQAFPGETIAGITEGAVAVPDDDPFDVIDTLWWTGPIDQHIFSGQTLSWTTDLSQIAAARLQIKYGLWNSPDLAMDVYVNNNYVGTVIADQGYISPGPEYALWGIGNYIVAGPDVIEVRAQTGGEAVVGHVGVGYKPSLGEAVEAPARLSLTPNPFNPTTTLRFEVPQAERVTLSIFDIAGREVATLVDGMQQPGSHTVTFDANGLPSGVYLCRLQVGAQTTTGKMVLMK